MPQLMRAEARAGYRIFVVFSDGLEGEIDLSSRLFGEVFEPLQDEKLFEQVFVDAFGVPTWPNGGDLAPDAIYEQLRQTR